VELQRMDILSSWYVSTEPYVMNATYALYLESESIEEEVAGTVGGAFFTTMLATKILEFWEDDDVDLRVDDVRFTYVEKEKEPSMGQWELAFLSLGIFLLSLATIVILLAVIREHYKKEYKQASKLSDTKSNQNLLHGSPRRNWDDDTIMIFPAGVELNGSVNDIPVPVAVVPPDTAGVEENSSELIEILLEEGEHKVDRKSVFTDNVSKHARRRTYGVTKSKNVYNIHDPNDTQRSVRTHLRCRSYAEGRSRRQTATDVRDLSRERRKTVLRNMKLKNSPKKAQVFEYPKVDEHGEVNITVRTKMSTLRKTPSQSPSSVN